MSVISARRVSLQQLQRRFERLRRLQERIRIPAADCFEAYGRTYTLPVRAKSQPDCSHLPPRTLEYLAGFFDGDGCVHGGRLMISQSVSSAKVLLFFRNVFGGGIYKSGNCATKGTRRQIVRWQISGLVAARAAALLGTIPSCKQAQLCIVASWCSQPSERLRAAHLLKQMKHAPPVVSSCLSWSFLAGFFDAEGCICLQYPSSIRLKISQKFVPVLHAVKHFLETHGFKSSICHNRNFSELGISGTAKCKDILQQLLIAGLRVKRESALAVLHLSATNFHETREALQGLVGNQSRYHRLTVPGLERAYDIRQLKRKLESACGAQQSEITSQLTNLQDVHQLECARDRYLQVRADIRSLLRSTAQLQVGKRSSNFSGVQDHPTSRSSAIDITESGP